MAGSASIKKIMNYFWGENDSAQEEYDEEFENSEYSYDYDEEEETGNDTLSLFRRKKVVQIPQPQQIKMKISKPTNFDQADEIVMQLKEKNAVVINLEYVSKDVARRGC